MKPVVLQSAVFAACLSACLWACTNTTSSAEDAGAIITERVCTVKEDCADEFQECIGGICQRPCGTDDACDFQQFCTRSGYCQTGCRDSSECGAMELCDEGICRNQSEVGTCATKADCVDPPNTNVCKDGTCQQPPAMCSGPQDCPGPQQCNGFSRSCFDPTPECMVAADCATKPACAAGCSCSGDRRCVATPTCTLQDEVTVCGVNSYCNTSMTPSRCAEAPTCTKQADCNAADLACNNATHICERSAPCTTNANCAVAPFTRCDTAQGFCQVPSCVNGGQMCTGGQTCNMATETCGSNMATCTSNNDCPTTPVLQYCNANTAFCANGCRSDANCNAAVGEKCNGAHACAIPTGSSSGGAGGGDGEACVDDTECRSGFRCAPLTGVCRETCVTGTCPLCPLTSPTYGCFSGFCTPAIMSTCP